VQGGHFALNTRWLGPMLFTLRFGWRR